MELNIIRLIEERLAAQPEAIGLIDATDAYRVIPLRELVASAKERAELFAASGVGKGGWVSTDGENSVAFVELLLAAAYGGFTVVALNARLTEEEKCDRIRSIESVLPSTDRPIRSIENALYGASPQTHSDTRDKRGSQDHETSRLTTTSFVAQSTLDTSTIAQDAQEPILHAKVDTCSSVSATNFDLKRRAVVMFTSGTSGRPKAASLSWGNILGAAAASNAVLNNGVYYSSDFALGETAFDGFTVSDSLSSINNPSAANNDAVLNTSFPLMDDATLGNAPVSSGRKAVLWQATLPFYHVGGMEIIFRSLLSGTPFILYRNFDASVVLADADRFGATHISVVDKTLRDLLNCADANKQAAGILQRYQCILLGGAVPNTTTLDVARRLNARVYVSYGMTETCSQIANARLTANFDGTLHLLPGYEAVIVDADESGFGQLAVSGPGVISEYVNAQAAFTRDGCLLTGDRARLVEERLQVAERTGDMFVSGGENIYPEEIRAKLLAYKGVTDAFVFGAEDEVWGRRPVAFVEAAYISQQDGFNEIAFADDIRRELSVRLSRLYQPRDIIVVPEFPCTGIGKVDRAALRTIYRERLAVTRLDVWRIKQPMVDTRTAKTQLKERESLIVAVCDAHGHTGIAEDVAFSTPWYGPETIEDDLQFIEKRIVPCIVGKTFIHPLQVSKYLAFQDKYGVDTSNDADDKPDTSNAHAVKKSNATDVAETANDSNATESMRSHPLACAAVEPALWDLYGAIVGKSVRELIDGRLETTEASSSHPVPPGWVAGGAVVGIASTRLVLDSVSRAVETGYTRVKLKIQPGHDLRIVRKVRERYPGLTLLLDANQSFTEADKETLIELSRLNIACIEEPLDPHKAPAVGPRGLFERLSRLQGELACPICLDESWTDAHELRRIVTNHPDLRCVAMKIGKFGGVQPALDFYYWARERGVAVWMGGMYDTGISKRLHAAFATLPGMLVPGDISSSSRYFDTEITTPPLTLERGMLEINPPEQAVGLGCALHQETIDELAVEHRVYE